MSAERQGAILFVVGLSLLGWGRLLFGCAAPALAECRLAAVAALPVHDPDALSVGDVRELAKALKACQAPAGADAGE